MSAGRQAGTQRSSMMVRLPEDVYAELVRIQQAIEAEHGWKVSLGDIIKAKLADQPVQP